MRVLLWLLRTRVNKYGEAPVYVRVTINGEREQFATGCFINPELWDNGKQQVKGRNKQVQATNTQLQAVKQKLNEIYGKASLSQDSVSALDVKNLFLNKDTEYFLCQAYDLHNKRIEPLVGKEYVKATYNRYLRERDHLSDFIYHRYKKRDIRLKDLEPMMLDYYVQFLKIEKKHQTNHVFRVIQRLKRVISFAIDNEWLAKSPFIDVKMKRTPVELVYLTEEELAKIENKEFDIQRLSLIKDLFLFQCYTGIAYRELELLEHKQIVVGSDNELWIDSTRQKTLKPFKVPLIPKAREMIDKYRSDGESKVFPVISNVRYNAYLKEIADVCGIDKRLTTHVGRKTFATTITLLNGVPLESVQAMLGHASIVTTQTSYAQVIDKKISRDMESLMNKKQ